MVNCSCIGRWRGKLWALNGPRATGDGRRATGDGDGRWAMGDRGERGEEKEREQQILRRYAPQDDSPSHPERSEGSAVTHSKPANADGADDADDAVTARDFVLVQRHLRFLRRLRLFFSESRDEWLMCGLASAVCCVGQLRCGHASARISANIAQLVSVWPDAGRLRQVHALTRKISA